MKISTIVFPIDEKKGKIFLMNKKRGFGAWHLNGYGGKMQTGDKTVEDAAVREMEEEGGVKTKAEDLEKMAVISFFEEEEGVFECHVYFCKKWEGNFKETEEMAYPEIYDIKNPPFEKMWDADRVWLPLICSGQKIRAVSIYEKGMGKQKSFKYESL